MKTHDEVKARLDKVLNRLCRKHVFNHTKRSPHNCVYNVRHVYTPRPSETDVKIAPRKQVTMMVIGDGSPVVSRLCLYKSDGKTCDLIVCDDDLTSGACRHFKPVLSTDECVELFIHNMKDDNYVMQNHKDVAALQWVLDIRGVKLSYYTIFYVYIVSVYCAVVQYFKRKR